MSIQYPLYSKKKVSVHTDTYTYKINTGGVLELKIGGRPISEEDYHIKIVFINGKLNKVDIGFNVTFDIRSTWIIYSEVAKQIEFIRESLKGTDCEE